MKKILIILWAMYFCFFIYADVSFSFDTDEVEFGIPINLTVNYDENSYSWDELDKEFEDFRHIRTDTAENQINMELIPLNDGVIEFGPKSFKFRDKDGEVIEFYNDTMSITVRSLLDDSENPEPKPSAGFFDFMSKYDFKRIGLTIFIILVIILIIAGIYIYRKRYKMKSLQKFLDPPHILALRELEELKIKNYIEDNKQKSYCVELSRILKNYIERRYHFNASEMTTFELENHFYNSNMDIFQFNKIIEYLKSMDLVKFAKYRLEREKLKNMFEFAREFIINTKEEEENEAGK
ncbi:MAG: hypothetical protein ACQESP_06675 [Candidatus Muiribacteriota bacterium]